MSDLGVDGLIYSASGARGVVNEGLTPGVALELAQAFGTWLRGSSGEGNPKVIVGYDTRSSGPMLEGCVVAGLLATGVDVVRVGVSPTPAIIHAQRTNRFSGGVIISGSHNPPQWNGLKCLGRDFTFLGQGALDEIAGTFTTPGRAYCAPWDGVGVVETLNPLPPYKEALFGAVDAGVIREAGLKVVVDPGGGAGAGVTDAFLSELGAKVTVVNGEKVDEHHFPRNLEPTQENLGDLHEAIAREGAAVGFAHDCDADRVAIAGDDGTVYPEDTGLALIVDDTLARAASEGKRGIIVTNVASSMVFDALAKKYGGSVVRTPVGERNLAVKMYELMPSLDPGEFVFGGEGSCGGVMFPAVNNARDGILASLKIVELLARRGEKLSKLVDELPKFSTSRRTIGASPERGKALVDAVGRQLEREGLGVTRVDHDIKLVFSDSWVLLHPSNTEPIIRVIAEAPSQREADELCRSYAARLEEAAK
ncbi:MAG: phosphoglucosamine mutase [Promethearchaeota archaeon]